MPDNEWKDVDEGWSDVNENKSSSNIVNDVLAPWGITTGVGLLGGKGLQVLARPFYQSAQLEKSALPMKKSLGLTKSTPITDLPTYINLKQQEFINSLSQQTDQSAVALKQAYPKWKQDTYSYWDKQTDAIVGKLAEKNINFDTKGFNSLLDKSAKYYEKTNPELSSSIRDRMVKSKGVGFSTCQPEYNLSFKDASSLISKLRTEFPEASSVIKSEWIKFLSNNPSLSKIPEIPDMINELYNNYVDFKKTTNRIDSLASKKNMGVLDTAKIKSFIEKAVNGTSDDAMRTLDYLRKGSSTVPPMEGAQQHFDILQGLKSEQSKINKMMSDASILSLRKEGINRAINRRFLGANIAGAGTALGKIGNIAKGSMLGVYPAFGGLSGAKESINAEKEFGVVGGLQYQLFKFYNPSKSIDDFRKLRSEKPKFEA